MQMRAECLVARIVGAQPLELPRIERRDLALGRDDAVLLERMRGEERRDAEWRGASLLDEPPEQGRDPVRIEPRGDHVQHRLRVRLRFVGPAVAREQRRAPDLDRRARDVAVAEPRERAPQPHREVRARLLLHLLHRVPAHDVADLVPDAPPRARRARCARSIRPRFT